MAIFVRNWAKYRHIFRRRMSCRILSQNSKNCLSLLSRLNTIQYYQLSIANNYPWRKCCSYLLIFNSVWLLYWLQYYIAMAIIFFQWGVVFSGQNSKSCLCLLSKLNTIQYCQLIIVLQEMLLLFTDILKKIFGKNYFFL